MDERRKREKRAVMLGTSPEKSYDNFGTPSPSEVASREVFVHFQPESEKKRSSLGSMCQPNTFFVQRWLCF